MSRDLIGVSLGKYHCVEFIGHGGMAEVYRAVDTELDRVVAIKVLHPFLITEDGFIERFRREARTLATLKHPNIVQIYDSGLQDFNSFVAMEYVPGPTLRDRLRELNARGEQMPIPEVRRILDALLLALSYAHRAGVVHRDLKPTNAILADDGRVVLTDFGLAKIVGSTVHTASMAMIGTPAYMAPEQAQSGAVDLRSDVYALGVILFELLTGKLPFEADTPFAMITKHSRETLPRVSSLRRDLPRSLDQVLFKATAKDPAERFQSVDQLAEALNAAFEGRRLPFRSIRPHLSRAARSRLAVATALLVVILGIGSASGWFAGGAPTLTPTAPSSPTPPPTPYLGAQITCAVDLVEQPDSTSPIVGQLEEGIEVAVLARSGSSWWQVRTLDGEMEGWVTVDCLDFIPTPPPTATLTNTPPPGASLTPTPAVTATPQPSATRTSSPVASPTPTPGDNPPSGTPPSPAPTRTPVATKIPPPTPQPTDTPISTSQPTDTPRPTQMPSPSSTDTPIPTPMPEPSATPIRTLSPSWTPPFGPTKAP